MSHKYKRNIKNKFYLHLKNFSDKLRKLPKIDSDIAPLDFQEMPDNCLISKSYLNIPFGRLRKIHCSIAPSNLEKDEGINLLKLNFEGKVVKRGQI